MSDKLSEADLALGRACAKVDGATMDNIAFGNLIAEIDRLRAENKELRGELAKVHELLDRLPVDIDELLSEE